MYRPFWLDGLATQFAHAIKPLHRSKSGEHLPPATRGASDTETEAARPGLVPRHKRMGKSNKFDYSNRPSSGIKLGKSIGGALEKEAEKVKKDADRHAAKSRKHSTDSGVGGSDGPQESSIHPIDLKAPSKQLTDEGVCALADGLEIALDSGTPEAALTLEDLNLSDNGITTASLARLAPIVLLAKHDLKTLDLSNNAIEVTNDEQAQQWEAFLQAFKDCFRLRRLDLSNNVGIGSRAFEILARVHAREPAVTPMPPGGEASVISLAEQRTEDEAMSVSGLKDYDGESDAFGRSLTHAAFIKRRAGLRAIPYITLQNVGLTDSGALWLSYVLEDHHYPVQLIDGLNATDAGSAIKTYQQSAHCHGVDWDANEASLGKEGLALLRKTEVVRRQNLLDETDPMAGSLLTEASEPPEVVVDNGRKHSRASIGNRRISLRSSHADEDADHELSGLQSARKRLQRHIIGDEKPRTVELWNAALDVIASARFMLRLAPPERNCYLGSLMYQSKAEMSETRQTSDVVAPAIIVNGHTRELSAEPGLAIDVCNANGTQPECRRTYAATLAVSDKATLGKPEVAVTTTTSPVTPKLRLTMHRKGAFSEGSDLAAVTEKLGNLVGRHGTAAQYLEWQQRKAVQYHDESVACRLPQVLMTRILREVVGERALEVLSEEQREAGCAWGQDRDTLGTGLEWLRWPESTQLWMLLGAVGCLAYGQ